MGSVGSVRIRASMLNTVVEEKVPQVKLEVEEQRRRCAMMHQHSGAAGRDEVAEVYI